MNVYRCWYQGMAGYACRGRQDWLFVPELGQPDSSMHRGVALTDLFFENLVEKRIEIERQAVLEERSLLRRLSACLIRRSGPASIYGQLLLPKPD